jgi:hypothetical protein
MAFTDPELREPWLYNFRMSDVYTVRKNKLIAFVEVLE